MKEFVLQVLAALKAIAAWTPTKLDDWLVDTILVNQNIIDIIIAILERRFAALHKTDVPANETPEQRQTRVRNTQLAASHVKVQSAETAYGLTKEEHEAFAKHGITIGQLLPLIDLILFFLDKIRK